MPGRSWDNDSSYRRRILAIVPLVLLLIATLVFVSRRVTPGEIYRYVGWRGELELMPEITIVPDDPAPDAAPAEDGTPPRETIVLDLAERDGEFEANPPLIEPDREERVAPLLDDFSPVPSEQVPERRAVSYSDRYVILKMVKPKYPALELAQGIEGNVTVELFVNEKGLVDHAGVVGALGPVAFQDSALEAARQFVFQPPTDGKGRPTTMWVKFLIKFRVYG